jgi:hypothetical protein
MELENLRPGGPLAMPGTSTKRQVDYFVSHFERDWLNPIAMGTLQHAVKERRQFVILNGIEFAITYLTKKYPLTGEREEVKLKRVDGLMAPFGFVSMKRILEFQFES